jgi:hypothetical protein
MAVQFDNPDFQQLVRVVEAIPKFAFARDGLHLMQVVFTGVPNVRAILSRID